jgi:hypothetical protein
MAEPQRVQAHRHFALTLNADAPLVPLPPQPRGVPWPVPDPDGWPTGQTIGGLVIAMYLPIFKMGQAVG